MLRMRGVTKRFGVVTMAVPLELIVNHECE